MNKFKKISMAAFGMLATVAPATAVFADETPTTVDNSTPVETKPLRMLDELITFTK